MRWDDVHLDRRVWVIPQTKSGLPLTLPLVDAALDVLRARLSHDNAGGYVFPASSKSGHMMDVREAWKRILSSAGLKDLRVHDLRRTFGSWQAAGGTSLHIIGKSLGHRNLATTQIYARLALDPVRQAVTASTDAMLLAAGGNGR